MGITEEGQAAIAAATTAYELCNMLNAMDGDYASSRIRTDGEEYDPRGPWGHACEAARMTLRLAFGSEIAELVDQRVWDSGETEVEKYVMMAAEEIGFMQLLRDRQGRSD